MKKYEIPQADITMFESADIITTSQVSTDSYAQNEIDMISGENGHFGL